MDRTVGMIDPQVSISIIMTFVTFLDVAPPDDLLTSEASIRTFAERAHKLADASMQLKWLRAALEHASNDGYSTWL